MKLNILMDDPGGVRSGYVNVDPFVQEGDRSRSWADPRNLSAVADPGECEEVVALGVLDCYPADAVDGVLDHWLSLLAHGGRLTVSVTDLREVARGFLAGAIGLDEANSLLHGGAVKKASALDLLSLAEVLENKGYKILHKRVVNRRAVVTCERP